ncbi:MAG TPA: thioredoxin family protein [Anaerolineales bacterium]|nr:thioredoxin family protein [Anaerolineales bacterium]
MHISVLGTGCYGCITLDALLQEMLVESRRTDVTIDRVSDEKAIRKYMPAEAIPGLVIDGRLVHSGSVPSRDMLRKWIGVAETQKTRI